MIRIIKTNFVEPLHFYKLELARNLSEELYSYLISAGFTEQEAVKIENKFNTFEDEYVFLKNELMKIHFFNSKSSVNMVIDTKLGRDEVQSLMSNHFTPLN